MSLLVAVVVWVVVWGPELAYGIRLRREMDHSHARMAAWLQAQRFNALTREEQDRELGRLLEQWRGQDQV